MCMWDERMRASNYFPPYLCVMSKMCTSRKDTETQNKCKRLFGLKNKDKIQKFVVTSEKTEFLFWVIQKWGKIISKFVFCETPLSSFFSPSPRIKKFVKVFEMFLLKTSPQRNVHRPIFYIRRSFDFEETSIFWIFPVSLLQLRLCLHTDESADVSACSCFLSAFHFRSCKRLLSRFRINV